MSNWLVETFTTGSTVSITAHTSDSGHSWSQVKGSTPPNVYAVSGGVATNGAAGSGAAQMAIASAVSTAADCTVTAQFYYDSTNFDFVGITGRTAADGNSGYLLAYAKAAQKWALWRVTATGGTELTELAAATSTTPYTAGATPTAVLKMTNNGGNVDIVCTVGGTDLITYTDSGAGKVTVAGRAGVYFISAQDSGMFVGSITGADVAGAATAPGAPTIGTATAGNAQVSCAFTAPASDGGAAITGYTATLYKVSDNTSAGSNTGASSPIVVTATNGVAVYAKVKATNSVGTGAESAASGNVTPSAVDTTKPMFGSAVVMDAAKSDIVITMSETLAAFTPATSAFAASGGRTVTGVARSGATVTVTVNTPYVYGDTINVTYTKPGSNMLQDAAGNQTDSFGPSAVTNSIAAPYVAPAQPLMAKYKDMVRETSTSTSAATITLAGAAAGFRSFATAYGGAAVQIPIFYGDAANGANWLTGFASFNGSNTLTVTSILTSSAGGTTPPTFGAGTKDVFVYLPAARTPHKDYIDLADYAVDPTFTTDSTAGIQQAVLDAYALNISEIRCPDGHFKLSGPLVGSGNCQIYIPNTREADPSKSIRFIGKGAPNWENQGLRNVVPTSNGTIFESTVMGAGTNPAVFGFEQPNNGDAWPWNYTNVSFLNLCVRTKVNAAGGASNTMGGINAQYAAQLPQIDMVRIDVSRGLQDMVECSNGSTGLRLPPIDNHALFNIGHVSVFGYYNGIIASEHVNINSYVSLGNINGLVLKPSYHASRIGLYTCEWTKNSIVMDGGHDCHISMYDVEHNSGGNFAFNADFLFNSGPGMLSITQSCAVLQGTGKVNTFVTNATSANYKIIVGAGAN